jgi:hypothetical protein
MAHNTDYLDMLTNLEIDNLEFNEIEILLKKLGVKIGRNKSKTELKELLMNYFSKMRTNCGIQKN